MTPLMLQLTFELGQVRRTMLMPLSRAATGAVLTLLASALCVATASAEPNITLKAGVGISRPHGEVEFFDGSRTSFSGGIGFEFQVRPWLSLQPELLMVSKGFDMARVTVDTGSDVLVFDFEQAVDYIEIPLLLRMRALTSNSVQPFFALGPAVAWKISEIRFVTGSVDEEMETHDFEDIDLSAAAAVGVELGLDPARVVVEARYTYGLREYAYDRLHSGVTQLLVGVAFHSAP